MNKSIVIQFDVKKNEVRLDSRIASEGFGRKSHKDFRYQVLEKYESEISQLGGVFSKEDPVTREVYWLLNESQLYFTCFLTTNSDWTVPLKLLAVKNIAQKNEKPELERILSFVDQLKKTPKNNTPTKTQVHTVVKRRLAQSLGGIQEFKTSYGIIDIVTSEEIIEVKHSAFRDTAIPQIIKYSKAFPDKTKRIHLFGPLLSNLDFLKYTEECMKNNCELTIEV